MGTIKCTIERGLKSKETLKPEINLNNQKILADKFNL